MITTKMIADWLEAVSEDLKVVVGPEMPDKPDVCATVTRGPGRVEYEGALDRGTFTVRLRGPMNDRERAELLIEDLRHRVDRALVPEGVSSCWNTGPSVPVPGTPDSGRRYEFVTTFVVLSI